MAEPEPANPARLAYCASFAAGAAGWLHLAHWRLGGEGWDNAAYFSTLLPLLFALAFVLGLLAPERPWRWAAVMFGAQALVGFIGKPTANLLPLGLILFAILSIPAIIAAYIGAFVRRVAAGRKRFSR